MGTKTKPPRMRVVYRRTDPYGTERAPFEVVRPYVTEDLRFYECATGEHAACERSTSAPIRCCGCSCHAVD